MFTLWIFQWAVRDLLLPVCKAAAHLWPKFGWCFRAANCAEACWLKTLLTTSSSCQMWLMQVSETLHAVRAHPLTDFCWNSVVCAFSPWLAQPVPPHCWCRELGKAAPRLTSGESTLWASQKRSWVCPKWIQGFPCCPSGWQSCGDVAPGRKPSQAEGRHSPNPVPRSSRHRAIISLWTHTHGQCTPSKTCFNSRTHSLRAETWLFSPSCGQSVSCMFSCVWCSVLSLERKGS